MQVGVVSNVLAPWGLEGGLRLAQDLGLSRIEIGCAGYLADRTFGDLSRLNASADSRSRWLDTIAAHGLEISAFALHGTPLDPNRQRAAEYSAEFLASCELASQVGVQRLTLLAGLPEGAPGDSAPCWVTSAFPPDNHDILEWQWEARVVPYWHTHARIASEHGCVLCFEMHPGDVVYNPSSFERLREAVGPRVACNFDPSHLLWQGIDPIEAIGRLGGAIAHVHAKDTALRPAQIRRDGILTAAPMDAIADRPWNFRTVGHGNDELYWRRVVSALREIAYDDAISIEHEDQYVPAELGLRQAARLVTSILV